MSTLAELNQLFKGRKGRLEVVSVLSADAVNLGPDDEPEPAPEVPAARPEPTPAAPAVPAAPTVESPPPAPAPQVEVITTPARRRG